MWWHLKKIKDDTEKIIYAYSKESDLLDGQIEYNKKTKKINCSKLALNDTSKSVQKFFTHVYRVIVKENAPDEKFITIG
ncbi:hypothetical protein [Clostridium sp. AWRP]|uniref:hypothetical protein n=1 Tax=Clostridium sp. AWRP TaxID=2212991 RepID=UPI000FD9BB1E|nr:hypothetical protein [Clostridium sp. AWRP]AZV58837.1 hypothetical protein DMR38_20880 [Clostridium sp. AWRP]